MDQTYFEQFKGDTYEAPYITAQINGRYYGYRYPVPDTLRIQTEVKIEDTATQVVISHNTAGRDVRYHNWSVMYHCEDGSEYVFCYAIDYVKGILAIRDELIAKGWAATEDRRDYADYIYLTITLERPNA